MKILVTGSKGKIGKYLIEKLSKEHEITSADLPEVDVKNYKKFSKIVEGHNAIIHCAWKAKTENWQNDNYDPENSLMFFNVYKAALEKNVKKVIMTSSIHADDYSEFLDKKPEKLLDPYSLPTPDSPYGANKNLMESLGRYFANKGLKVSCLRIGGIGEKPSDLKEGKKVWLSFNDFSSLVKKILDSENMPNYSIINAVSNNKEKIHDTKNLFGWKPKDDSDKFK